MPNVTAGLIEDVTSLGRAIGREVRIMEVCGTHTVSIFRNGLRSVMPENLALVSGPGCPVCVTAQRHIDAAIELAEIEDLIVTTYGDMMRVPGRRGSLERQRAAGGDVRVVQSSLGALRIAERNPGREVVFLGVGFETTAPATAAAVLQAKRRKTDNFSVLVAHKLVVPAMLALLENGEDAIDGFLCPGHVSVIIGAEAYRPVVDRFRKPCVVAGFEPAAILSSLALLLTQIREGCPRLKNNYEMAVGSEGNPVALGLLRKVFHEADTPWRALGVIPRSGLAFRDPFRDYDAVGRFGIEIGEDEDHPACRCGEVIQGKVTPDQCSLFGTVCTTRDPVGPCMVSSEGTCSAWFKYGRPRG